MYNLEVDTIFKKNHTVIKKLFESLVTVNKYYIQMDDCKKLVYLANLNIDYYKIAPIFGECVMG